MEQLAYLIKYWFPGLFPAIEGLARPITGLRFGRRRAAALAEARVTGTVDGLPAEIRHLQAPDAGALTDFLASMPEGNLEFFQPHGFDVGTVTRVVSSQAFMTYGLFMDGSLRAYGLLKLTPTGCAFIGLLVGPRLHGRGLGRFLVRYLYWQASQAGFRARSTISQHNVASVRAHKAVAEYRVVAAMPNDYLMIEFPLMQVEPPVLRN